MSTKTLLLALLTHGRAEAPSICARCRIYTKPSPAGPQSGPNTALLTTHLTTQPESVASQDGMRLVRLKVQGWALFFSWPEAKCPTPKSLSTYFTCITLHILP